MSTETTGTIFSKDTKFTETSVNGVATIKIDDETYINGTDIDKKVLKEVEKYNKQYLAEASTFGSERATEVMKKDANINKVIVEFPFTTAKDGNASVIADRSKTFRGMNGSPDITRSNVKMVVKAPSMAASKAHLKRLHTEMTATLL